MTLLSAVTNVLRMLDGWSGDPETAAGLLDEIRDELMRGLGETQTPEPCDDAQDNIDTTLDALGLKGK